MSRIEELIEKLCPNGVEYKTLGELGKFYGGITGKSKEDFKNGNAKFITYKNVYDNISLKLDVEDRVKIGETENQRTLEYGDIIFTGSSETPNECGISSVLTEKTDEKLYLNSFCFFFRFNDKEIMNPEFAKHLFRSSDLRYQIGKTASGVTRYNVSKKLMEGVCIPVPPLEVQCEIVHILDELTLLSAELMAEQNARRIQYEYYRDNIFNNLDKYTKFSLGDIVEFINGRAYKQEELLDSGKYKVLRVGNFGTNDRWYYSNIELEDDKYCNKGDLLYLWSASFGPQIWEDEKTIFHYHIWKLRFNETEINKEFLYYFLDYDKENLKSLTTNSTMPHISMTNMKTRDIYLPPIEMQRKIVKYLNAFYTLANSNLSGLPAEIEARRKQYEYYRNKLLTFKRIGE